MRSLTCLGIFMFYCISVSAQSEGQSLAAFDWLIGTWQNLSTKPGETATETWTFADDHLEGIGLTMAGADTAFIERLKILWKDGAFHYVADVAHNPAPVFFEMTAIDSAGFVCENPAHDFPKKIVYAYDGDILIATISAGKRAIPFRFRKM